MLSRELNIKKNIRMVDGLVRGKTPMYDEFITDEKEIVIGRDLISVLNAKHDISKYVTVVKVNRLRGSYPYVDLHKAELTDTTQLDINGDLTNIETTKIDYEARTFRGALNVSTELMQDAEDSGINYGEVISQQAKQIDINTKNREVINLFKMATPKTITSNAELTTLINTYFKSVYDIKMFISSSLYDLLDKANEIDHTEGYPTYKGKEIVKLDDTDIGTTEGDLKGFIGDAKEFIHLFDRENVTVKNINGVEFISPIRVSTRLDVKVSNEDAGTYITYTI